MDSDGPVLVAVDLTSRQASPFGTGTSTSKYCDDFALRRYVMQLHGNTLRSKHLRADEASS